MSHPSELDVFRCQLDGINLIEASAGTGKTWNICGLYLRLLLERRLDVQQILVVTFTNAATAELRERIRTRIVESADYLTQRNDLAGDPFVPRLIAELMDQHAIDADEILRRLDLALQTFDEAAIFTIHGFCQRALADNPFSAGLPMAMELVQDDSDLLMEAVHDFWRRHIAGDALTPMSAAYLDARGDTPQKYAKLLERHLAKPLAICRWPDDIDDTVSMDGAALEAAYVLARATWLTQRDDILALLNDSLSSLNGKTYKPESLLQGAQSWDEIFRASGPLIALGEKCELYCASKLADRTKKKCVTPSHPFFDHAEAYLAQRGALDAALAIVRLRLLRSLIDEAGSQLRDLKRSRRVVSYDDMLFNVYERLTNGHFPWLAASLETRFPAALIDEFQDTDPLQYEIFHTIYGAGDAPVFLVGDPKQAIYSFRNADLHTYLRAKQQTRAEHSLVANQRSSEGLLTALNGLFETNLRAFMLPGLDYQRVAYGKKPRKSFVDLSEARADLQVWRLPADGTDPIPKKLARRAVVQATAAEIARLMNEAGAGRITVNGMPLRPGDIAVLVRSHAQGTEMKRALAALRIGSVELSQASVFETVDAEDLETVLKAILEPARDRLVRAALATELFGCDAAEIEAISSDESRLMARLHQFSGYRDTWLRRGFGVMYRRLLADEHVARRMLGRPDGERRLTNFLHLGESLHQTAETHPSPEALLRFLQTRRSDGTTDDSAQLRLESDQNLVQIVTIHKAKGLEYPIVFCPFLWDGRTSFADSGIEGREYHDEDDLPVIDFRGEGIAAAEHRAIKDKIRLENAAEFLRLIYVALTRAVYRCYLVAGCYSLISFGKPSATESRRSMLNWLVAGTGTPSQDWFNHTKSVAEIHAAWDALAHRAGPSVDVSPLPLLAGTPIDNMAPDPESLMALTAPAQIAEGWRLSSYSGLSYGAISEQAASDHDGRIIALPRIDPLPAAVAMDDILRFPRGAAAGECAHAVFEAIDFTDSKTWDGAIASALTNFPQTLYGLPETVQRQRLSSMLYRLVDDVMRTEIIDGLRLNTIPADRRLTELDFSLPVPQMSATHLNDTLKALGYAVPRLTFGRLIGYLKGFIDLVFEHRGRYFILDWKSNHLGYEPADYATAPVSAAMAEHGYHLQYLLYTVALDRYLRRRMANYDYEMHFGGVLYLFVRGVRPTWRAAAGSPPGVYFHRPDAGDVRRLNAILNASQPEATTR